MADNNKLPTFATPDDLHVLELVPDIIWAFDLDDHCFWWGNQRALDFWQLESVDQLCAIDLSDDTESARRRIEQTFERALADGVTADPWTAYPKGNARNMLMRHKAVLLGPEKHRGAIAFVSESVDLTQAAEQITFAETVRYTSVAVSCFSMAGTLLYQNPAASELYGYNARDEAEESSLFTSRFCINAEGEERLATGQSRSDSQRDHLMHTRRGIRKHSVDIRTSRHPFTGDYILVVSENNVTELHKALTEAEQAKEELRRMVHSDALTGVASLRLCHDRLAEAISSAAKQQTAVAVMFIDLDGFKPINDQHGHYVGDQVLKLVADRLRNTVRDTDTLGRIGGDEFLLILSLPTIEAKTGAELVARNALECLVQPFNVAMEQGGKVQVTLSASIGIAMYPWEGNTSDALLKAADRAMYRVKQQGKSGFGFHNGIQQQEPKANPTPR